VGTARAALAALTATTEPRPVWPASAPIAPPTNMAVATTASESLAVCQSNSGTPVGPVQFAEVVNQPKTCARKCTQRPLDPASSVARLQGTATRSAITRSRSAIAAITTDSTSPTTIGV
jgi:hypothetical protein